MIQALYDVETRAKELTWQDRQALRQRESTLILASLQKWLESRPLQEVLPKSDFAEAVAVSAQPLGGAERVRARRPHPHR